MLFGSSKIIIYVGLSKLVVGDCQNEKPVFFQIDYSENPLESFDQIITKYPKSDFKIILGSDVSYTVSWPKSGDTPSRDLVKLELQKYIPEEFAENQFDWKIDKQNNIEAIVATGDLYKTLTELSTKYKSIRFETQSAISLLSEMGESNLAKETGGEIFVYAASKGAQTGSDQKVLDLNISGRAKQSSAIFSKYSLFIIIAIIISTILAIYGLTTYLKQPVTNTPEIMTTPTPSSSPVVRAPKDISLYTVTIQNGTKIDGLASSTKEALSLIGFTQISTTNSSTPSSTTKVILKEALPDDLQQKIITSLGSRVPEISLTSISQNESNDDIVILLGEK